MFRACPDHPFGNPQTDQYGRSRQTDQYGNAQTDQYGNAQVDQYGNAQTGQSGNGQADQSGNVQTGQFGNAQADQSGIMRSNQPGNQRTDQTWNSRTPIIDTVGKTSAEINWEYALIERLDEHDLSTRLIPFQPRQRDRQPHISGQSAI